MIVTLLILLAAPALGAPQSDADALYALGARLYDEGDFRGAAAAFEGAAATGWTSPSLELALGASYFEAGELGRAVLHFERARRLAPRDPDVQQNLRLAREAAGLSPVALSPTDAAARWLAVTVGAGGVAVGAFALYLAVLGLLAGWIWTEAPRTVLRRALLVLVPLLVLATVAAVGAARFETQPRGVVMSDAAVVRDAPLAEATVTEQVPEGTVLVITDGGAGWIAIRLPTGETGWIAAAALEEV